MIDAVLILHVSISKVVSAHFDRNSRAELCEESAHAVVVVWCTYCPVGPRIQYVAVTALTTFDGRSPYKTNAMNPKWHHVEIQPDSTILNLSTGIL